MNDDEALEALAAGDEAEIQSAKEWLVDAYLERLIAYLEDVASFEQDLAVTGAGQALMELFDDDSARLHGRSGAVWLWLVRRGSDRAKTEFKRTHKIPPGYKRLSDEHDLSEVASTELTPTPSAWPETGEENGPLHEFLRQGMPGLGEDDRRLLLHDAVWEYELLTPEQAELVDDELISSAKLADIYTPEALRKKRQRLLKKLQQVPALRRSR